MLSFGYKHGVPVDADLVFDVRCLPNPHFVPALRRRTGRDRAGGRVHGARRVARASSSSGSRTTCASSCRHYVAEGKSYLTIAIGCTGGRHRSVMIAERLKRALAAIDGARVRVGTETSRYVSQGQVRLEIGESRLAGKPESQILI